MLAAIEQFDKNDQTLLLLSLLMLERWRRKQVSSFLFLSLILLLLLLLLATTSGHATTRAWLCSKHADYFRCCPSTLSVLHSVAQCRLADQNNLSLDCRLADQNILFLCAGLSICRPSNLLA
jgi:hypothetical protein